MSREKIRRKALEVFLSGKQVSGRGTEVDQKELSKEDLEELKIFLLPITTREMKLRSREEGSVTPRQTFRCDEALWKRFQEVARKKGKTASEVLRDFIFNYVQV